MFVHVHGVTHHPGIRLIERFNWFQFLKRHHYIHHIDNGCNVKFLLPLCDLLFGTLRTQLRPKEIERWGTYEQALVRVVPVDKGPPLASLPRSGRDDVLRDFEQATKENVSQQMDN
jgi:hypothetical protein